jgi:hypothetical protein
VKHALVLALAMAALSLSCRARAEATRILVVPNEEMKGISARLSAELRTQGFEVIVAASPMLETRRELIEDAAREAHSVAALCVRPSHAGVEVWVMDPLTQKTVLREVVAEKEGDDALLAVRAVELLRASLLKVEAPHFGPGAAAPSPATDALVSKPLPARAAATSIEVGPAVSFSPGGISAAPHVFASLRWHIAARFDLGVTAIAPTLPAAVAHAEGRATVTLASAAMGSDYLLLPRSSVYGARVGLGTGVLWAHLEGAAAPGFRSRGADVFTSISFVNIGASRALGSMLRVWLDASVALTAQRFVVRFAQHDVADWGRPAFFGALGLEFPVL